MNKKGLGATWAVAIMLVVVIVAGTGFYMYSQNAATAASIASRYASVAVDYDGEFTDAGAPDEVVGGSIAVETAYEEHATANTANITFDTVADLENSSVGAKIIAPFMFDINGEGFEDMEIECDFAAATTKDELIITDAYVLKDEDTNTLSSDDKESGWDLDLDTDRDAFDMDHDTPVVDGEYILVIELDSIATSGLETDDEILTCTLKGDTSDDLDELEITFTVG